MSRHAHFLLVVLVALAAMTPAALGQTPLGTAFTYQGQLKKNGLPVSALADFQFRLWDASDSGNPVSSVLQVDNKEVLNGLFTARLDFGSSAFAGEARWLEIAVRSPAGGGSYTTLAPRQEVTPTAYALYGAVAGTATNSTYADNADKVDGFHVGNIAGRVPLNNDTVNATLVADKLDGYHAGNSSGQIPVSNGQWCINLNADRLDDQDGSYYQNASNLNAGTIAEARLPQNAIDSSEIEDGSIMNVDVSASAAIAPSKISGTAWTYSTDGYPPRCGYDAYSGFQTTSGSYTTVTSVTITLPANGYVFAEASAAADYWNNPYEGMFGIGFDSTTPGSYTERWIKMPDNTHPLPVGTAQMASMNSGSRTIYFMAKRTSGTGPLWFPRYSLSVIFIDTQGKATLIEAPRTEPQFLARPVDGVGPRP
jgi:hypothetical protein